MSDQLGMLPCPSLYHVWPPTRLWHHLWVIICPPGLTEQRVKARVASRHKWADRGFKIFVASSVLLIGTAIGLIYYWIDFYVKGGVQAVNEDWYIRFQKAFTAADLWTAVCAIIGAIGLLAGQTYGALFAFIAASSLIFLGLMDVTFNIQNNLYRLIGKSGQMKFELFINLWTLGLGIALIVLFWPSLALV